jgi:hypothetical protein
MDKAQSLVYEKVEELTQRVHALGFDFRKRQFRTRIRMEISGWEFAW